jgi:hypothetical protein
LIGLLRWRVGHYLCCLMKEPRTADSGAAIAGKSGTGGHLIFQFNPLFLQIFHVFQDRPVVDVVVLETMALEESAEQAEQILVINASIVIARHLDMIEIFYELIRQALAQL